MGLTPRLDWTNVGTGKYLVFISKAGNCQTNTTPVDTVLLTSYTVPSPLQAGTTYEWRVVPVDGNLPCTGQAMACTSFKTQPPCPLAPALSSSTPGLSTPGQHTFTWNAVANAATYEVWLGLDSAPNRVSTQTATTYTFDVAANHNVEIFVTAVSTTQGCTPAASNHIAFSTCPDLAAPLLSPGAGASFDAGTTIAFSWSAVAGATGYDLMISSDAGSTFIPVVSSNATATTASRTFTAGSYLWSVRAKYPSPCGSISAQARAFVVNAAPICPTAKATLLTPVSGANVTLPVAFTWTEVADAEDYNVYAVTATGLAPTLIGSAGKGSLSVTTLPQGTSAWFVQTLFDKCPSTESSRFPITVVSTNCPTTRPTLTRPANQATSVENPVEFDWTDVPGAIGYRVYASLNGGTSAAITTTKESELVQTIPAGSVEWYVEALFDACPAVPSVHFTFSTQSAGGCPANPGKPSIIAPADGATGLLSPVTLQWSAVTGATGYRVIGGVSGSPDNFTIASTTSTQVTVNLSKGTWTWTVVALFGENCATTASKAATFTVSTGAACSTAGAAPVAPAHGATDVASPVTFQWSAVAGAIEYVLYASFDNGAFDDFAETSATTVQRIVPAGSISWYVVTRFAGCPDVKSSTVQFTVAQATSCPGGSITLTSPAKGATVSSPVTFSWSAVANATSYRLWVSAAGATTPIATRVSGTSATLPLSSGSVEWFVEALFAVCPSIFSAHSTFTVQQGSSCGTNQPPTLVSPALNATVTETVDLTWSAAPGAIGYRVWAAAAGQPFGDVGATKDTHLAQPFPDGSWTWYVEAFFEACPAQKSAPSLFKVQGATKCSGDLPTLIAPTDGAAGVTSPVTLLWSSVPGAREYRVFASLDGAPEILIAEAEETSITRAVPPGVVRWRVEATSRDCPSTTSSIARFTTAQSQNCSGEAAQLVSPADNATVSTQPVTFSWNPVSGAAGYVLFVEINEGAETPVAQTSSSNYSLDLPAGTIEWWIVTFVNGCGATESKHFEFTIPASDCPGQKPLILAPRDGTEGVSPVTFSWTPVSGAKGYKVWIADPDGASLLASTTATEVIRQLPLGTQIWFVDAFFDGTCPPTHSAPSRIRVIPAPSGCPPPGKPLLAVAGQVSGGSTYNVRWTPQPGADHYELQEATSSAFSPAVEQVVSGLSAAFTHSASASPTTYFYRVRAVSGCSDERGPYSEVAGVVVLPPAPSSSRQHISAEIGTPSTVVQTLFLAGQQAPITFTATADRPWITIAPSSGTLPPAGLTLTITSDPSALALGTNTGTITITYGAAAGSRAQPNATTVTAIPLSVSLVTGVSPTGKNTPPPDSLIIPGVAHAPGANNSDFESDVRVANTSVQTMKYQLNFTPSGVDGTQTGSSTTIQIAPGATMALDDIVASFFGAGIATTGMLEIRPLTSTSSNAAFTSTVSSVTQRATVASSRTFNVTPAGTLGQFVPAIPFSQFIGKTSGSLSLQQIAQSAAFRTNIGLVEAAGEPADVLIRVFDALGSKVGEFLQSLKAGEHLQLNGLLATNGISLDNGRVEVSVLSDTGRVSAYASTLDNVTNDPIMVFPVLASAVSANRYVLPGIGDFDSGFAHWKSDVRIYNPSTTATAATLSYYPQGAPTDSRTTAITLQPGEVRAIDDFIATTFPMTATAGDLVVATASASSLVVTARTYTDTGNGTYGQFIPAATPQGSVGLGDRALQILQLEQSSRMRTNVGVTETTGSPATAEFTVILPDSRVSPKVQIPLAANEFRQIPLAGLGLADVYNVRVAVAVVAGTGKVTAYGSVIDQVTQDPTYVPAQ